MTNSEKGSQIAKNGFRNEDNVVAKFNRWYEDTDAQQWLYIMGYPVDDIENVQAFKLHGYKTDRCPSSNSN